jgi:hypothetical protein
MENSLSKMHKLVEIVLITPVSTVESELWFSIPKRVKTYFRNYMEQECLNALAVPSIHRDVIETETETPASIFCPLIWLNMVTQVYRAPTEGVMAKE